MDDVVEEFKISPEIAKAVIGVMGKLGTLSKDKSNKFDGYKFASIDDFIEFVRTPCTEEGLFIIPQELDEPKLINVKKKNGDDMAMWWARYAFVLAHSEGSISSPINKTVMVQASGAQSSGSAQSYALKQLMRALFQIPTGDKDDPDKKGVEISTAAQTLNSDQEKAIKLKKKMEKCVDESDLNNIWEENSIFIEDIKKKSEKLHRHLNDFYDACLNKIKGN